MTQGLAWDDKSLLEKSDSAWAAGCRHLQSWWRDKNNLPIGQLSTSRPRPVASMLPIGFDRRANFFSENVVAAIDARLDSGLDAGIINTDRLYRNLLSSQPACFNLFGEFAAQPDALLPWVRTIDPEATHVTLVDFEWAPDKKQHFNGGSAFDAYIEYNAGSAPRFLGVECKYAEDLSKSSIKVRPPYIAFTDDNPDLWMDGASIRLDVASLRQFWLNTLLAQSLCKKAGFDQGRVVVVASTFDAKAEQATALVRSELRNPDGSLVWSPYETVIDAMRESYPEWADWFSHRYLDFAPVAHLLASSDCRLGGSVPRRSTA